MDGDPVDSNAHADGLRRFGAGDGRPVPRGAGTPDSAFGPNGSGRSTMAVERLPQ